MKKQMLFLSLLLIVISGCKKEETVDPTVVTSNIYTASSWLYSSPYHYYNINVSEITADVLKSASISVYFSTDNGTSWTAVPFTQYTTTSNYFMGYNTQVGKVQITWVFNSTLSHGDDPNEYYGTSVQFKVVIVSKEAA